MKILKFIRGILLFGSIIQTVHYARHIAALKNADEANINQFQMEQIFTKFLRAKEKILYGTSLTVEQRAYIDKHIIQSTHKNIEGLLLGKYLKPNGKVVFNKYVDLPFITLSGVLLLLGCALIGGICIDLILLDASVTAKIISISGTIIAIGLPLLFVTYVCLSPALSLLKHKKYLSRSNY